MAIERSWSQRPPAWVRAKAPEGIRGQAVLQRARDEYVDFVTQFLGTQDRAVAVGLLSFLTGLLMMRLVDRQRTDYADTAAWFVDLMTRQRTAPNHEDTESF
jgi:hypothetical protein